MKQEYLEMVDQMDTDIKELKERLTTANRAKKQAQQDALTEAFAELGRAYAVAEKMENIDPAPAGIPATLDRIAEMIEDIKTLDQLASEREESEDIEIPPLSFQ